MKSRYINTKFWSDNFVGDLEPIEKLLFLYFLTNEHTNISGVYEISFRTISFETGINQQDVETILEKLDDKVVYYHGFVIVKNFYRHQQSNYSINIGIAAQLRELPPKIITKLQSMDYPVEALIKKGENEKNLYKEKLKNRKRIADGFED